MNYPLKKTMDAQPVKTDLSTYRGMKLAPVKAASNFTREELVKAIEAAIAKNARALASGG